jgi:kynurenine formamidase
MSKIIDLSVSLGPDVSLVPGHPAVEYVPIHTHEQHHRANATIYFSIHVGTHIDPPYHFCQDGWTIDQVPLERLMGIAHVLRLKGKLSPQEAVRIEHFLEQGLTQEKLKDQFVIIYSGWSEENYGSSDYYRKGYYLSTELAEWLVEAGVKAIALDHPPDEPGVNDSFNGSEAPVHRTLLGNRVCIIENITNLNQITKDELQFYAIPIKISDGCGGPARVFVIE